MAAASQQIDRNHKVINSNEAFVTSKTIAFDGSAGNGAQGTANLFTVSGDVLVQLVGACTESLAGASATISVGITGNTAGLIAVTTATNITNGVGWNDSTPSTVELLVNSATPRLLVNGPDIFATIATANITDGTVKIYCLWRPLSTDGSIVAV